MIATEIVDHILSFLHSDQDYTTLETCAAVLPEIVHRHLYSEITLYTPSSNPSEVPTWNGKGTYLVDPTQFSLVLLDRPHVADCVRALRIAVQTNSDATKSTSLAVIASILSSLSRIESIALTTTSIFSWASLGPTFCTALVNSIRLPLIRQFVISNIDGFSLRAFDGCKNLRALQLYGRCADGECVSTSSYPRLCSLVIDSRPELTRVVSWMKSNTLHTLSLRINSYENLLRCRTLMEACSTTLVNLDISFGKS